MGREIRKVPAGWQHPRNDKGYYIPLHDGSISERQKLWDEQNEQWQLGFRRDWRTKEYKPKDANHDGTFEDWDGKRPDPADYVPDWTEQEKTHFVVYETVTEGTPVTPVFATPEELVEHLATKGTDWDNGQGWDRHSAEEFVKDGWAPSGLGRPGQGFKTVNEPGFYDD